MPLAGDLLVVEIGENWVAVDTIESQGSECWFCGRHSSYHGNVNSEWRLLTKRQRQSTLTDLTH